MPMPTRAGSRRVMSSCSIWSRQPKSTAAGSAPPRRRLARSTIAMRPGSRRICLISATGSRGWCERRSWRLPQALRRCWISAAVLVWSGVAVGRPRRRDDRGRRGAGHAGSGWCEEHLCRAGRCRPARLAACRSPGLACHRRGRCPDLLRRPDRGVCRCTGALGARRRVHLFARGTGDDAGRRTRGPVGRSAVPVASAMMPPTSRTRWPRLVWRCAAWNRKCSASMAVRVCQVGWWWRARETAPAVDMHSRQPQSTKIQPTPIQATQTQSTQTQSTQMEPTGVPA